MLSIHTQTVFYATKFFEIFSTAVTAKICKNKCPLLLCSYQEAEQQLHFIMCQHVGTTFHFLFAVAWLVTFFSGYQLTANEVTNSHHKTETNSLNMLTMCFSESLFIMYQLLLLVVLLCGEIFHSQTAKLNFLFFLNHTLLFGFCEDILGCFKRNKTSLFSLFLQMLFPFSRRPDTEDQLKRGVHIYFERKVQTTSTKWWSHSNVCCVWVEPRCSTLFAPLGLPNNLLLGVGLGKMRTQMQTKNTVEKGKKTDHTKEIQNMKNPQQVKKKRQEPKNRHQQLNKYRFGRKDLKLTTDRPTMTEGEAGT